MPKFAIFFLIFTWESAVLACLNTTEADNANVEYFKAEGVVLESVEVGNKDHMTFPQRLFRIKSLGDNPTSNQIPFFSDSNVVAKIRNLIKKDIPVFLNPRCELYGAAVFFPGETQAHLLKSVQDISGARRKRRLYKGLRMGRPAERRLVHWEFFPEVLRTAKHL